MRAAILIILCVGLVFAYVLHGAINTITTAVEGKEVRGYGPDIRHCLADDQSRELWDCIRNE